MIESLTPTAVDKTSPRSEKLTAQALACGAVAAPRRRLRDPYAAVRFAATAVGAPAAVAVTEGTAAAAGVFTALVLLLDRNAGRHILLPSALDELPALALRTLAATAIVLTAGLPIGGVSGAGPRSIALGPMLVAAACVALIGATRAAGYAVIRRLRARRRAGDPVLVVGAGSAGARLVALLREHPEYGLLPVGFLDSAPRPTRKGRPVPVLGGTAELPRLVARHRIRRVIVAFSAQPDGELVDVLRACERLDCEIYVVPRLFELATSGSPDTEHVWGLPCVRLPRAPFRTPAWRVKRILDVGIAAAGLIALAPLLLLIALAVRLEVGRGVLFRQERVGLDGQVFSLVKFRSLRPAPGGRPDGWSVVAGERMGPVGRFLRRTSLDELPQLWNVLIGQMSLVGPRPELPRYVQLFAETYPRYAGRLRVPAGVTGLAQVTGLRGNTSIEERVLFDNFYVEHWSLWRDVKIIARTVGSVLFMRGA